MYENCVFWEDETFGLKTALHVTDSVRAGIGSGLRKRTGKILPMPQIPSQTSASWGKLSSEMFFPSHRNFHCIKNVPFFYTEMK